MIGHAALFWMSVFFLRMVFGDISGGGRDEVAVDDWKSRLHRLVDTCHEIGGGKRRKVTGEPPPPLPLQMHLRKTLKFFL